MPWRALRLLALCFAAWAVALPLCLGPAEATLVDLVGDATTEHGCACGMAQGACGCPECELLVLWAAEDGAHETGPVFRSHCMRDDVRAPLGAPPPATASSTPARLVAPYVGTPAPRPRLAALATQWQPEITTPPPRRVAA